MMLGVGVRTAHAMEAQSSRTLVLHSTMTMVVMVMDPRVRTKRMMRIRSTMTKKTQADSP